MHASSLAPRDLFGGLLHFQIPAFQRPYVWNEEDQWAPLWDDIERVAENYIDAKRRGIASPEGHHFLGAVVFESKPPVAGDVVRHDVIDGQQRMTTMQLVLDAAEAALSERGHEFEAEALEALILNPTRRFVGKPERFKLWPSQTDRKAFEAAMDPAVSFAGEHRIIEAHRYFGNEAANWLAGEALETDEDVAESRPLSTEAERAEALVSTLMDRLMVVAIDLTGHDDAQLIFETLNDRGTPLLKADLVKNWVFRMGEKVGADVELWSAEVWAEFDDDWWRGEVRQGRLMRSRIDVFLQYWLTMMRQDEVKADRLFPVFVDIATPHFSTKESAIEFVRTLRSDADAFRALGDLDENTPEGRFYRRVVEDLELAATTPVLLWLLSERNGVPSDERAIALQALESWVIRRTLLRLTTKDVNKFMVSLLKHLRTDSPVAAGDSVVTYLSEQTADTRAWPADSAVRAQLPQVKLYWNVRQSRLRLVLAGIEAHLRASDPRYGSTAVESGLSLEHVMPRAWRQHWDTSPSLTPDEAAARDALVDTLGNLTLVTQSLNSSLSNRPWENGDATGLVEGGRPGWGKRQLLDQFNLLVLNKQVLDRTEPWDDSAIRERSAALAQAICEIWPGPDDEVQRAAAEERLAPPQLEQVGLADGRKRSPWSDAEIELLARKAQPASTRLLDHLALHSGTWWNGTMLTEAGVAVNPHGTVGAITVAVDAHLQRETPIWFSKIDGRWHWSLDESFASRWRDVRATQTTDWSGAGND